MLYAYSTHRRHSDQAEGCSDVIQRRVVHKSQVQPSPGKHETKDGEVLVRDGAVRREQGWMALIDNKYSKPGRTGECPSLKLGTRTGCCRNSVVLQAQRANQEDKCWDQAGSLMLP